MREWATDIGAAAAWGGLILLYAFEVIDSSTAIAIAPLLGASALLGVVSGRYRVLLAPVVAAGVLIVVSILGVGSCDGAPSCEEDEDSWWGLVLFLVYFGLLIEICIAAGVAIRRTYDTEEG